MSWDDVVVELEEATARLDATSVDDFLAMAEAMNRRSLAVERLREFAREQPATIPLPVLDRIRDDSRRVLDAQERLLLHRAAARAEITRLTESSHLMRALARPNGRTARRVDCRG
jgi:hypothetical protein